MLDYGGNSLDVQSQLDNVIDIFSTWGAFAALKQDGSVVTWGSKRHGGDSTAAQGDLQANVAHIYSSSVAFAAVKKDGSIVTWGDPQCCRDTFELNAFA